MDAVAEPLVEERQQRGDALRGRIEVVDPEAVGAGLTAFVSVTLERPGNRAAFLRRDAREVP